MSEADVVIGISIGIAVVVVVFYALFIWQLATKWDRLTDIKWAYLLSMLTGFGPVIAFFLLLANVGVMGDLAYYKKLAVPILGRS